jgi:predicted ATPase/DNA-binding SARP family transcriptional activator
VGIYVLGTIAVGDGVTAPRPIRGHRPRLLLARLATRAGQAVSEDALADAIWGDARPQRWRAALQLYISQLRTELEPTRPRRSPGRFLRTDPFGYVLLSVAPDLDAATFESLITEAIAGDVEDSRSRDLIARALAMWGPPLAELADESWARGFVTRLSDLRAIALERRFLAGLRAGEDEALVHELRAATEDYPYRERLAGQLALALYRAGRQTEALASCASTRRRLREDLGVDPGRELALLERAILAHDPALSRSDDALEPRRRGRSTTRELTSFVGRQADVTALVDALGRCRLVSIIGPGGSGKSRLARRVLDSVDGERWTVELATTTDQDSVVRAVARAVGVLEHPLAPLVDVVADVLRDQPGILLLDTCEHVIDHVGEIVDQLLGETPIVVLTTSRRPLGVAEEHCHQLAGLSVIAEGDCTGAARSDAERLLLDRAGVTTRDESALDHGTIAELCRRLDGLPLAIELAAPKLRVLGARQLIRNLRLHPELLAGPPGALPRHRDLDALVRWSYDQLTTEEQATLFALSAVAGSFDLDFAERLLSAEPALVATPVSVVIGLVETSLLSVDDVAGRTRYRLLDTVRAFAGAEAARGGHAEAIAARHAHAVVALVGEIQRAERHGERGRWRLEDLADEVSPALAWLGCNELDDCLAVATSLALFWQRTGRVAEGRQLLGRLLDSVSSDGTEVDPMRHAVAWAASGSLAWYQGDFAAVDRACANAAALVDGLGVPLLSAILDASRHFARHRLSEAESSIIEAIALARKPGRDRHVVLHMGGDIARFAGALGLAADRFADAARIAEQLGDADSLSQELRCEGVMRAYLGDHDRAVGLTRRAFDIAAGGDDRRRTAQAHAHLAAALAETADVEAAHRHASAAVRDSVAQFDSYALLLAVPLLVDLEASMGSAPLAARLCGWFHQMLAELSTFTEPRAEARLRRAEIMLRDRLGPTDLRDLVAAGRSARLADLATELAATS